MMSFIRQTIFPYYIFRDSTATAAQSSENAADDNNSQAKIGKESFDSEDLLKTLSPILHLHFFGPIGEGKELDFSDQNEGKNFICFLKGETLEVGEVADFVNLCQLASLYQVETLKEQCIQWCDFLLRSDNVEDLLKYSLELAWPELQFACLKFTLKNDVDLDNIREMDFRIFLKSDIAHDLFFDLFCLAFHYERKDVLDALINFETAKLNKLSIDVDQENIFFFIEFCLWAEDNNLAFLRDLKNGLRNFFKKCETEKIDCFGGFLYYFFRYSYSAGILPIFHTATKSDERTKEFLLKVSNKVFEHNVLSGEMEPLINFWIEYYCDSCSSKYDVFASQDTHSWLKALDFEKKYLRKVGCPSENLKDPMSARCVKMSQNPRLFRSHIINEYSSYRRLEELNLAKLGLEDGNLRLFKGHRLQILDLSDNALTKDSFHIIAEITTLRELYLSGNPLKQADFSTLTGMKNLEVLDVSSSQLTLREVAKIKGVTSLRSLNLKKNHIRSPKLLKYLAEMTNLTSLDISENLNGHHTNVNTSTERSYTTNKIISFEPLAALQNLERLYVNSVNLTNDNLRELLPLRELAVLEASCNYKINRGALEILSKYPKLEQIDITHTFMLHVGEHKHSDILVYFDTSPWICVLIDECAYFPEGVKNYYGGTIKEWLYKREETSDN